MVLVVYVATWILDLHYFLYLPRETVFVVEPQFNCSQCSVTFLVIRYEQGPWMILVHSTTYTPLQPSAQVQKRIKQALQRYVKALLCNTLLLTLECIANFSGHTRLLSYCNKTFLLSTMLCTIRSSCQSLVYPYRSTRQWSSDFCFWTKVKQYYNARNKSVALTWFDQKFCWQLNWLHEQL